MKTRWLTAAAMTAVALLGAFSASAAYATDPLPLDPGYVTDDAGWARSKALFAAAAKDDDALRAAISIVHVLALPEEALADQALARRVAELGHRAASAPPSGPTRRDVLDAIGYASAA